MMVAGPDVVVVGHDQLARSLQHARSDQIVHTPENVGVKEPLGIANPVGRNPEDGFFARKQSHQHPIS